MRSGLNFSRPESESSSILGRLFLFSDCSALSPVTQTLAPSNDLRRGCTFLTPQQFLRDLTDLNIAFIPCPLTSSSRLAVSGKKLSIFTLYLARVLSMSAYVSGNNLPVSRVTILTGSLFLQMMSVKIWSSSPRDVVKTIPCG